MHTSSIKYPHLVSCYRLTARDGNPPLPEDEPLETVEVNSKEESDKAIKELQGRYPGGWCVERPIS